MRDPERRDLMAMKCGYEKGRLTEVEVEADSTVLALGDTFLTLPNAVLTFSSRKVNLRRSEGVQYSR